MILGYFAFIPVKKYWCKTPTSTCVILRDFRIKIKHLSNTMKKKIYTKENWRLLCIHQTLETTVTHMTCSFVSLVHGQIQKIKPLNTSSMEIDMYLSIAKVEFLHDFGICWWSGGTSPGCLLRFDFLWLHK